MSEKLKILRVRKNPNEVVPYTPEVLRARPKPKPAPAGGPAQIEGPKKRRRRKKKTFIQKHLTQRSKKRKKPSAYYIIQVILGEYREVAGKRKKEKWVAVDSGYWQGDRLTKNRKEAERYPLQKDARRVGKVIAKNFEGVVAVMVLKVGK